MDDVGSPATPVLRRTGLGMFETEALGVVCVAAWLGSTVDGRENGIVWQDSRAGNCGRVWKGKNRPSEG